MNNVVDLSWFDTSCAVSCMSDEWIGVELTQLKKDLRIYGLRYNLDSLSLVHNIMNAS